MPVLLRSFASLTNVINRKSLLVAALALASTWLCLRFDIKADFPLTLIATAIVFPIVFSIGTAYQRREKALEEYGILRANGRALILASRDWVTERSALRDDKAKTGIHKLLVATRDLVSGPLAEADARELKIGAAFLQLSDFVSDMRAANLSSTEVSRLNQYLSRMMAAVENLKNIYEYRTPRTLRAFSELFILLLSVLYGPYFAFQADRFHHEYFWIMPVLFAFILVGLSNIQDHLENPFDQLGQDDVRIEPDRVLAAIDSRDEA